MKVQNAFIVALFTSLALPVWALSPKLVEPPAKPTTTADQKDKDGKKDKDDKKGTDDKKGKDHKKHTHKHKE